MFRKLIMVGAVLVAVLAPIGVAAASTVDDRVPGVDDPVVFRTPAVQQVAPECDGACDGAGHGAGPRDGAGPVNVGPADGAGNRFGAVDGIRGGRSAGGQRGYGAGARDGAGPVHVGPADGTGNRFGVANGVRNPDDGFECDGTRRHAPTTDDVAS